LSGDPLPRNPITGIAGCCARAASGNAAIVPVISKMNSRRFIANPAPDTLNPSVSKFSVQVQVVRCPEMGSFPDLRGCNRDVRF
jgi:hypothetical protein